MRRRIRSSKRHIIEVDRARESEVKKTRAEIGAHGRQAEEHSRRVPLTCGATGSGAHLHTYTRTHTTSAKARVSAVRATAPCPAQPRRSTVDSRQRSSPSLSLVRSPLPSRPGRRTSRRELRQRREEKEKAPGQEMPILAPYWSRGFCKARPRTRLRRAGETRSGASGRGSNGCLSARQRANVLRLTTRN
jgi:hypothetical protein